MDVNKDTKYTELLAIAKKSGIKGIRKKELLIAAINANNKNIVKKEAASPKEVSSKEVSPKKIVKTLDDITNKFKSTIKDLSIDKITPEAIPHIQKKENSYYSTICLVYSNTKIPEYDAPIYKLCGYESDAFRILSAYIEFYNLLDSNNLLRNQLELGTKHLTKVQKYTQVFTILKEEVLSKRLSFIGEDIFSAVDILEKILKGDKPIIPIDSKLIPLSINLYEVVINIWNSTSNKKLALLDNTPLMFYRKNVVIPRGFFFTIYDTYGLEYLANMEEFYCSVTHEASNSLIHGYNKYMVITNVLYSLTRLDEIRELLSKGIGSPLVVYHWLGMSKARNKYIITTLIPFKNSAWYKALYALGNDKVYSVFHMVRSLLPTPDDQKDISLTDSA